MGIFYCPTLYEEIPVFLRLFVLKIIIALGFPAQGVEKMLVV